MRIISRYIRDGFLTTFIATLVVFTFVMTVVALFRITDYIAMGGSIRLIARIFMAGMPLALSYSIPISVLTACLLTFGRLSANGEITAMKSSGVSMWQIIRTPLVYAALCSAICLYLNADFVPRGYHARTKAVRALGAETPLQLLEEGHFIRNFPGFTFYFGSRNGDEIRDVIIYQRLANGVREIDAKSGRILPSPDGKLLLIDLSDVRIDPFDEGRPGAGHCERFPLNIDLGAMLGSEDVPLKKNDMTLVELDSRVRHIDWFLPDLPPPQQEKEASIFRVEFHKRFVLSASCLAFALLGIPLATRTHRRESSIGIAMSLVLVFFFYLFTIVAEALAQRPAVHPWAIAWIPVGVALVLGLYLIHRNN